MNVVKEKPKLDPILNAHIWVTGHKIGQSAQYTDALKACGFLKEPKTVNFEVQNSKMNFYILPELVYSFCGNIRFVDICKIEEKGSDLLRNKNTSRSNQILIEKHSKTIPGWVKESCSCLLAPEDWN